MTRLWGKSREQHTHPTAPELGRSRL